VARCQWGIDDIPDQQCRLAVVRGMISSINYNVERGQVTADTFQRERPEADGPGRRTGPRPGRSRHCAPRRGDDARLGGRPLSPV